MQSNFGWSGRARRVGALVGITAICVASVALWSPTAQPVEAVGAANNWLGYINEYRTESGLGQVRRETSWDQGTYNHSCYMNQNGLTHDEVPGKPGYTASGAEAGKNSNLAGKYNSSGDQTTDAKKVIDRWMTAPYHAIGMLRPKWTSTSLGLCYTGGTTPQFSATLDVVRGTSAGNDRTVVFPGSGATTHLNRFYSETPNPTADCNPSTAWGLPLIAMFPKAATNATATVRGPGVTWTAPQLCVLDYQDITNPTGSSITRSANAVIIIPPAHLGDGKYSVSVSAGGQSVSWSFTVKASSSPPNTTTTTTPRPTTTAPRPTTTAPRPTTTAPRPTTTAPRPTTTAPRTTTTAPRTPPVATFTPGTEQNVKFGQTLSFDGSASNDPDGGRVTYEWRSTGVNGIASRGSTYSRTFNQEGRVGIELTVTDDEGQVNRKHINVWVTPSKPPVATFTPGSEQNVKFGQTLSFDGSASNDPDGGRVTYEWRSTGVNGIASRGSTYSRTFNQEGRVGIELTVTDDEGQVNRKHINVWVTASKPPVATFTPGRDQNARVGQTLSFDGSASKDPDGGRVTYEWRSTGVNGVASRGSSYSRKFTKAGRVGIELTVTDDEGQVTKKHINVWVS